MLCSSLSREDCREFRVMAGSHTHGWIKQAYDVAHPSDHHPSLPPSLLPPKHRHLLSPPRYRKAKRTKLGTADPPQTADSFLLLDLLMCVLSLPLKRKPPAAAEAVPSNTLASRSTVKARRACCGPRCATTMVLLSSLYLPCFVG
jgi:hypothetical protein